MRKSHLFIGLATSVLLAGGSAAASQHGGQGEEWPAFDQIDRDSDGVLTQEEMQDVSGLEQQMDEDQITRQEYEELQQQEQGASQEGMESESTESMSESDDPELVPPETMEEMPEEGEESGY